MKAILKKVSDLDFFIGFMGGVEIPTKQDKFKPIYGGQKLYIESGEEIELNDMDVLIKKR
jgi:hypothetical protein